MMKRNIEPGPDGFRFDLLPPGATVLCALSGGADSMYLLCRLREAGYAVHAAHYNHRLRPTAQRDEDFVRDWCRAHAVPLTVGSGDVAAQAVRQRLGIEACARRMRYAFLARCAKETGCTVIATAHHAGDNAETVLMNLIRGCGLNGLTGIPERRGDIVRPMLAVTRRSIEGWLACHGVPHVEDETNRDEVYTRNRVRHRLLPMLEELNPRAVEHIAAAALRLREDEEELSRQARILEERARSRGNGLSIRTDALTAAPRPIALRAVGALMACAGGTGGAGHREQVLGLASGQRPSGGLDLPGCSVRLVDGELLFTPKDGLEPPEPTPLREGVQYWGGWRIVCTAASCPEAPGRPDSFFLAPGEYVIRTRRTGDGLRPPNRSYKTLKKWMIEQKIPGPLRPWVPVLSLDGRAVAAGGIGVDGGALACPGQPCCHVTMEEGEEK